MWLFGVSCSKVTEHSQIMPLFSIPIIKFVESFLMSSTEHFKNVIGEKII